jgi:hypothetical protein
MKGESGCGASKNEGDAIPRKSKETPHVYTTKAWFLGGMFVVGARRGQPTRMRVKPTKMKNMDMPPHEQQSPAV